MMNLTIPAMTCGHCESRVRQAIAALDPSAHVEVSLSDKRVRIGSEQPQHKIVAALAEAGYPPALE
ncbi:heavy-metal-associated domain-containing protein [Uliginosibacterium sp. sgz301328]|uniref:heavy-metal-associated domain-containing protein n=1 Tax=Uliginosibacterium sp. sgz301328 TaxID=3243764 RepID=UPI00359E3348